MSSEQRESLRQNSTSGQSLLLHRGRERPRHRRYLSRARKQSRCQLPHRTGWSNLAGEKLRLK